MPLGVLITSLHYNQIKKHLIWKKDQTLKSLTSNTNTMEGRVSETLLIAQYVPVSTLRRSLNITHFFAFKSSMEPLTIK